MPHVRFDKLTIHHTYSRPELAELWKYSGYQALARGVVTPSGHAYIMLFVTAEKQEGLEQYADRLVEDRLHWEGPTDHFAEDRMLAAKDTSDEIHVLYRARHHSDFEYLGRAEVESCCRFLDRPSTFVLRLTDV